MKGASGRTVADALGITEGAVRKHKKPGGSLAGALHDDGSFNLERAKALYRSNVDPAMQRARPSAPTPTPTGDSVALPGPAPAGAPASDRPGPGASADYGKVRTALTYENVLIAQVKRKKAQGTAIEKGPTLALVQTLARMFRDGALGFTDKFYTQIAADLGKTEEAHLVYEVLDRYMRLYVETHLAKVRNEVLA